MKVFWYCVYVLAIVQIADFVTWLLKKTAGKRKKGDAKEGVKLDTDKETGKVAEKVIELKKEEPFWKKVKWGIAAAVLILVFALKQSESVCDWIAAHNVDNGGLKLFDAIALWLGILKFFWSMSYDLKLYTWREACYSPTETELLNLRIELVVASIFFTFIPLCGWLGIEYSFIFLAVLVVLGLLSWITSPIVLKVIKK